MVHHISVNWWFLKMADTPDINDLIDLILIDRLTQSEDESSDAWVCHILQHFGHITFQFTFLLVFMTKRREKALCKPITLLQQAFV